MPVPAEIAASKQINLITYRKDGTPVPTPVWHVAEGNTVTTVSAAEITYSQVSGSWRDPVDNVPGSQAGDPVITNGVPTSIIRWGDTSGTQSGYDFNAANPLPPPFQLPGPAGFPLFSLGSFTHHNFVVDDPSLVADDGLHPSGPQYAAWVEAILPVVKRLLEE